MPRVPRRRRLPPRHKPCLEALEDRTLPALNFGAPITLASLGTPVALALADFNGDAKPDLAVLSGFFSDSRLSVLAGNGDGTFTAPSTLVYPKGVVPVALAAGDLNSDGRPDLVSANSGGTLGAQGDGVSVFLNSGNGTFQGPVNLSAGAGPQGVVLADFNGDGKLDLAVANANFLSAGPGTVSLLPGNGNGTFGPVTAYPAGSIPFGLAVGDFNRDGKPDLAVANRTADASGTNTVTVLMNIGNGTFRAPARFPIATGATAVVVGDFNGDGKPDLATGNFDDTSVSVLLGNGDGSFAPAGAFPVTASGPIALAAGDFSGDAKTDLVTADLSGNSASLLLGNGNGSFAPAANLVVGASPHAVVAGDVNGDGKLDLAVADQDGGDVSILLGNGNGTFLGATRAGLNFAAGTAPVAVAAADFDRDGKLDLAAADRDGNAVTFLVGKGDGTFFPPVNLPTDTGPAALTATDLNGDGKADLAVANGGANDVTVLLGNGNGTFGPARSFPAGNRPAALLAADFNNDGKPDVAVANTVGNDVSILLGNGNGTFAPGPRLTAGTGPAAIATGDFNGDGRADLAVANGGGSSVSVFLGNANGTFTAASAWAAGSGPVALVVGDFNGDGKPDLAAADGPGGTVTLVLGKGDGTFNPGPVLTVGLKPSALAAADLDGDGKLDLAVANSVTNTAIILLGNGDGSFAAPSTARTGSVPVGLAVGDFNGDGSPDLATANSGSDNASVLLNLAGVAVRLSTSPSPSTFGQEVTFQAAVTPTVRGTAPTGAITFRAADPHPAGPEGSRSLATVPLDGKGQASFPTTALEAGTLTITAAYGGDGTFVPSVSPGVDQVVARVGSATLLASSLNPSQTDSVNGQPVTFTATVTAVAPVSGTPTGTVTFLDGNATLGTAALDGHGLATFTTAALAPGFHAIAAQYAGDNNFEPSSSSTLSQAVSLAVATSTELSSFPNPAAPGQPVALTATVTRIFPPGVAGGPATGAAIALTGSVGFFDGTTPLGSVPIAPNGVATFTATFAAGNHTLAAVYSGDIHFIPSTSGPLVELVNACSGSPTVCFITQLYRDLLGRDPDPPSLAYFSSVLDQGQVTTEFLIHQLQTSPEYRTQLVRQGYLRYLGRPADAGGLSYWTNFLAQGGTSESLQLALLGSTEYFSRRGGGTNAGFLEALYPNAVDRPIQPGEAQFWTQAFAAGATRAEVVAIVLASREADNAVIQELYLDLLHRPAEAGAVSYFGAALQQGASREQVVGVLVGSQEYRVQITSALHQRYVAAVYRDLLGREAGPNDITFWTGLLNQGRLTPAEFVRQVQVSPEYRTATVQELYVTYLHRPADAQGLTLFTNALAAGLPRDQLALVMVGGPEYYQARGHGTPDGYLDALYPDVLGRPVDAGSRTVLKQLLAGGASPAQVAALILNSDEHRQYLVRRDYEDFLGRDPTAADLAFWVAALRQGAREEQLVAALATAEEYFRRV